jgi:hypothetical protein
VHTIVDRIAGEVLGTLSDQDLHVIQDVLADEGPFDTDYYLQDTALELLSHAGLSPDGLALLKDSLEHRGGEVEFGWERFNESTTAIVGQVLEQFGHPVPGCKVEIYAKERNQFWSFTRADGKFEVNLADDSAGTFKMRLSGLEDIELWLGEIDVEAGTVEDVGTLEVVAVDPPESAVEDIETVAAE